MGKKRMFSKDIVRSDAFLSMPLSTQTLYFHLMMETDDDGLVGNSIAIKRMIGASDDDLKLLAARGFLIVFDSGVIAVKHFGMQNTVRKDRRVPTAYIDEFSQLALKENGSYTLRANQVATKWQPCDNHVTTNWQPTDNQMTAQYKLSKDKLSKDSCCCIDNVSSSDTDDNNNGDSSKSRLAEIRELLEAKGMPKSERQSFLDYNCAEHGDEAVLSMSDEKIAYLAGRWMACSNSRK